MNLDPDIIVPFDTSNDTLTTTLAKDIYLLNYDNLNYVIERIPFLTYVGQLDIKDGPYSIQAWMDNLDAVTD